MENSGSAQPTKTDLNSPNERQRDAAKNISLRHGINLKTSEHDHPDIR